MRHESLPQTLSPEKLAEWIQINKVDTFNHTEEIPFTEEEIQELEHKSSLASRAIDKLTGVEKYFKELIKKGTPFNEDRGEYQPISVTIPPTKGVDALKANREFADKQIELGYKEDITHLYLVPNPEVSEMLMVDIEGQEWPEYSRNMTNDEINQFKPLLRGSTAGLKYDGVYQNGTMNFTVEEEFYKEPVKTTRSNKKAQKEDFTDPDL